MSATVMLTLPLTEAKVRTLKAGDFVTLDGEIVITAGLPTHHRIIEYMERRQAAADRHHRRHALPSRQLQPRHATARSRCST